MSTPDFDNFFSKYQKPIVEELTIGYSGIDPPLRHDAQTLDHEQLNNLLGGNDKGHYHIKKRQLEQLINKYEQDFNPRILPNQLINAIYDNDINPYEVLGRNTKLTNRKQGE